MVYLDASAVVKRYVEEVGSRLVQHVVLRHKPVATTRLCYVEVHAALARRYRERSLTESGYQSASRQFETDFPRYTRIEVRPELVASAKRLAIRHALLALDAVHLASALRLQERLGRPVVFVAAARRLLTAAEAEGLKIFDVERPHARTKDFDQLWSVGR